MLLRVQVRTVAESQKKVLNNIILTVGSHRAASVYVIRTVMSHSKTQ